ncbi:WD40 repeat-containing protein [Naegleria gruberi]|uniref:WD40 repeat-containing protein n=1 Tax=Naegleria gruberi TaxID=5762 RepID=D2VUU4_NAEGR|nr:WD40 repeat-containing protein [Naegleria gruberi]EFC39322.1 WD40 repeat-containing protein [Naegleria gruberi]|eukprot:XP_002672066.1 WD40 repeat-containing protein [Naegleria gruberi strain NEG-M]
MPSSKEERKSSSSKIADKPKYELLTDKDFKRAEQLTEEKKLQDKDFQDKEKKQRKERNEFLFKKTKNLLKTYEKSKFYQKTKLLTNDALDKYKRKSTIDEKPIPKREMAFYQYKNKLANKQEVSRNILWTDVDRSKAEARLARSEVLRTKENEERGIELDDSDIYSKTYQLSQEAILKDVDENTRKKIFDIELTQYSPYKIQYSLSGRKLLLGGVKGHISTLDWRKFEMLHENHFSEPCKAVQWLMDDGMYAVAQSPFTYVYNEQGVEIHMCRDFHKVEFLSYLPFHYLLVGASRQQNLPTGNSGQIIFKDISLGENVSTVKLDPISCMTPNPYNAVMCVGHLNGTVSMVLPRDKDYKPVVSMFCHQAPIKHLAVDPTGRYMVTSAADDKVKVWDIRNTYQPLTTVDTLEHLNQIRPKNGDHITSMAVSQSGMVAVSLKHTVAIWKNLTHINQADKEIYLLHKMPNHTTVSDLSFCPYEDILGVGHSRGFSSLIVPGSGSSSYDSRMPNPYFTDKQVKDFNVRTLLEKIPYEMICLDPTVIGTSGMREKDHSYSSQVEISEELKQELSRVGLKEEERKEAEKRKRLTSRDQYREELFNKYQEMKAAIPKNWYDEEDADALDRFASLKKRKIKYDEKKREDTRKQQEQTEESDRVKQLKRQLSGDDSGDEEESSGDEDENMLKLSSSGKKKQQEGDEDDEEQDDEEQMDNQADDDEDEEEQEDDEDQQANISEESDDYESDESEEEDTNSIIDPFA